ncbi:hypothetical protein ABIE61_002224, partial [Marinobacterium sp. MBR-111]
HLIPKTPVSLRPGFLHWGEAQADGRQKKGPGAFPAAGSVTDFPVTELARAQLYSVFDTIFGTIGFNSRQLLLHVALFMQVLHQIIKTDDTDDRHGIVTFHFLNGR